MAGEVDSLELVLHRFPSVEELLMVLHVLHRHHHPLLPLLLPLRLPADPKVHLPLLLPQREQAGASVRVGTPAAGSEEVGGKTPYAGTSAAEEAGTAWVLGRMRTWVRPVVLGRACRRERSEGQRWECDEE